MVYRMAYTHPTAFDAFAPMSATWGGWFHAKDVVANPPPGLAKAGASWEPPAGAKPLCHIHGAADTSISPYMSINPTDRSAVGTMA